MNLHVWRAFPVLRRSLKWDQRSGLNRRGVMVQSKIRERRSAQPTTDNPNGKWLKLLPSHSCSSAASAVRLKENHHTWSRAYGFKVLMIQCTLYVYTVVLSHTSHSSYFFGNALRWALRHQQIKPSTIYSLPVPLWHYNQWGSECATSAAVPCTRDTVSPLSATTPRYNIVANVCTV